MSRIKIKNNRIVHDYRGFQYKEVETLPTSKKVATINSFVDIDQKAFGKLRDVEEYEFDKKSKEDSYKLRRRIEYGLCYGGGITIALVLIASFSAVMEWITNPLLEALFITIMGCFISVIVGFALGIFYQKSK